MGQDRQQRPDEPVEFKKQLAQLQDFRKIVDWFNGEYTSP